MKRTSLMLIAAALAIAPHARAWDSKCDATCTAAGGEGTATAHNRMTDDVNHADEHRRIFLEALALAGAPQEADSTLQTYVAGGGSFAPTSFLTAVAVQPRPYAPSEFAQLPDFSYSLWDWALGNETCPLGNFFLTGGLCHSFLGHMGATNSNHFVPQSKTHYARYHALAMDRARDCGTLRTKLAGRAELQRFVSACESEALVFEAIGHHYLGDAWAAGHTWQRWGSPNETDFPFGVVQAGAIGAIAGLVHGGRAVLQDLLPQGSDANDPMNAPSPNVLVSSPAGPIPMVGDIYLNTVRQSSTGQYSAQYNGMYGCMVGSLRAVLAAAGETLAAPTVTPRDPSTDAGCFGLRATNQALRTGFGIDFKTPDGTQQSFPLDQLAPGLVLVPGALAALSPTVGTLAQSLVGPVQFDVLRMGTTLTIQAALDPMATDMAEGGLGPLLGMSPNGQFDRLGAYVDPALPWPASAASPTTQELALLRQFHESHAREWCGLFKAGDPQNDLEQLRTRASSASGAERDAACEICVEFVERSLRIGEEATYDPATSQEPLCGLIADSPSSVQYVYSPVSRGASVPRRQLARSYCGCDPLQASAGTFHNEVTGAFQTSLLVRLRTAGDAIPGVDVPFTLEGPPAWNGGAAVPMTYPRGWVRQFFTAPAAPVSGVYTVRATIDGVVRTAQSTIDATQILASPMNVTPDLSVANQVGSTWTAAPGAGSYLTRVFDITAQRILNPVVFTTNTSEALVGVPVNGAHQSALQVWAFSNDMRVPDPPMPPQFNLSFNRTLLASSITVSGGGTVAPNSPNGVGATVTGLAGTAVTWSATGGSLAPSGNSATWTAPAQNGNYSVTATSVSNPTIHASVTFTVQGGAACDPNAVPQMFAGSYRVIESYPSIFNNPRACGLPAYVSFMEGASFSISSGGLLSSTGISNVNGAFGCGSNIPFFRAGGTETDLGFDPTDPDKITGQITLRSGKYLPCVAQLTAVRVP